jgi:hypothetical protein
LQILEYTEEDAARDERARAEAELVRRDAAIQARAARRGSEDVGGWSQRVCDGAGAEATPGSTRVDVAASAHSAAYDNVRAKIIHKRADGDGGVPTKKAKWGEYPPCDTLLVKGIDPYSSEQRVLAAVCQIPGFRCDILCVILVNVFLIPFPPVCLRL